MNKFKDVFEKIKLKNNTEKEVTGIIRTIKDEKYLPDLMHLQNIIFDHLDREDSLQSFPEDFMQQHIKEKGFILGVFCNEKLIAFRNTYFPDIDDSEWNLGLDLGFSDKELARVVNFQLVCVHPDFRGNSLANTLNNLAIKTLKSNYPHYHLCATVSPYNVWNIRVLLDSGFIIKKLKTKYNGKLRYIVYQDLRRDYHPKKTPDIPVELLDFTKQKELFKQNILGMDIKYNGYDRMPQKIDLQNVEIFFGNH